MNVGIRQSVRRQRHGVFCSLKPSGWFWGPPNPLFNGYRSSQPGVKRPEVKLTTHLHLVLRLRISGDIPSQPLYAFMSCIGANVPSTNKAICQIYISVQYIMHRQYTTYIKQDAIIIIRLYLATCFGRNRHFQVN